MPNSWPIIRVDNARELMAMASNKGKMLGILQYPPSGKERCLQMLQ